MTLNTTEIPPFIQLISQLRESSKSAIVNGEDYTLTDLQKYLHIEREVQTELSKVIEQSAKVERQQLILVCGNVGDGKSHILSYLNDNIGSRFYIHNDATESHNPDESFVDTLDEILKDFQDENLGSSNQKIILAINLGTLNNFLDEKGDKYPQLIKYVEQIGILDSDKVTSEEYFNESSPFQYVNFTDYQLYELSESGAKSEVLSHLFNKVFANDENNPIYKSYQSFKAKFQSFNSPIIYNYDFLCSPDNQAIIVDLMIKSIVKSKGIVSLRSILNFIHDIIIPIQFRVNTMVELEEAHSNIKTKEYAQAILPYYIFEHSELSNLFAIIAEEDPCNVRSEKIDDSIVKITNAGDITGFMKSHYSDRVFLGKLPELARKIQKDREILTKLHTRILYFENSETYGIDDKNYAQYISYLYHLNNGTKSEIKKLYQLVINACKKWNGNPNANDTIIVEVGQKQKKYRILQSFKPKPLPPPSSDKHQTVIKKFLPQLKVAFEGQNKEKIRLYIDNGLLKLLSRVDEGYRPNKLDKNSYINFINFLNKLITAEQDVKTLKIDEVNIGKNIDYIFSKDAFGEYTFEKA